MEKIFYIFNHDDENWIFLDTFVDYLRQHHVPSDRHKEVKHSNVTAQLKSDIWPLKKIDEKTAVPLTSVLKYIFHNTDNLKSCKELAQHFTLKLYQPHDFHKSIFELYKEISSIDINLNEILEHIQIEDESLLTTLYIDYKVNFEDHNWKKICIFEKNFSMICNDDLTFEESVKDRWDFLDTIKKCRIIGQMLIKQSATVIKVREKRFQSNELMNCIHLQAESKHVANKIDQAILLHLQHHFPNWFDDISCVDTEDSRLHNTLLIFLQLKSDEECVPENVANCIEIELSNSHNVHCEKVVFLKRNVFERHKEIGKVGRFSLRDNFLKKKIIDDTVLIQKHSMTAYDDLLYNDEIDEYSLCQACFSSDPLYKPLNIQEFNACQEWVCDVPLIVQALFEPFINRDTLRYVSDRSIFLKAKLERLYFIYDNLMNVHNKKFTGVIQKANTEELLIGYKSISTVFQLTSKYGATKSLTSAERDMIENSRPDDRYYHAYLRGYPMSFMTQAGMISTQVRMRDTIPVFMIDNLVRLKFNDDPDPGESRSKQMCTLPCTMQGLSKKHVELQSWHNNDICDGSSNCVCKKSVQLGTGDVESVLLQLSNEEMTAMQKFRGLCTWGNSVIWNAAKHTETWDKIMDEISKPVNFSDQADSLIPQATTSNSNDNFETICTDMIDSDDEEDEDLYNLLENAAHNNGLELVNDDSDLDDSIFDFIDDITNISFDDGNDLYPEQNKSDTNISNLEHSFHGISLNAMAEESLESEDNTTTRQEPLPVQIGLKKYSPPPLLYLHPMPYEGRDDEISKLKEVLDDVITKLGHYEENTETCDKILFGPDNKIGNNLIKLIRANKRYEIFLPEFPCLHMRKSKINNIFSAYKNCGLVQMLQYMKDDDTKEWSKLLTSDHIEVATRNVRRLAQSLHILMLTKFLGSLPKVDSQQLLSELQSQHVDILATKWNEKYTVFIEKCCKVNATFALHRDMMTQLDHVLAFSLAERLGGSDGHNLLLAAVKEGIAFGFLNGAVAYAPYCVQLIYEHYRAGPFYKCLKQSLFSTPLKNSKANFGTDTKRELDHIDVMKGFRSGSTMTTVMRRMSMVDSWNSFQNTKDTTALVEKDDNLGWNTTEQDIKHVVPLIGLLCRRAHLSAEAELFPCNMYDKKKSLLPQSILNDNCTDVGKYMIMKYLAKEGLFGVTPENVPKCNTLDGPKELIAKVKKSKGVTIKRVGAKITVLQRSERENKEEKRKKIVARQTKRADCLSSDMNMVQALVKPDCSKPKVQKARGMVLALTDLVLGFPGNLTSEQMAHSVADEKMMYSGVKSIPVSISQNIVFVTMEFAGAKFKTKALTGKQYLKQIENGLIKDILRQLPNVQRMVVCEEKYSFTPDDFKSATRSQRTSKKQSIAHLKTAKEMLSAGKFHKDSLVTTTEGKSLISMYLAANAGKLDIQKEIILDIDSELELHGCSCSNVDLACHCKKFATPIRFLFGENGFKSSELLQQIKQRKGEAEMSQVDWLFDHIQLKPGEAVASIVTSGDIDAVVIHLYAISQKWPRTADGKFENEVFVVLQKPLKKLDIFNITSILEKLENKYGNYEIGKTTALTLCLGGNDFIPKFYGISHSAILKCIFTDDRFRSSLFIPGETSARINLNTLLDIMKALYCPKHKDHQNLSYEEVRQLTIMKRSVKGKEVMTADMMSSQYRNPQQWLPPDCAIKAFAQLVDLQIEYMDTVGHPEACLPNFLSKSVLRKSSTGEIEYDFGTESYMPSPDVLVLPITSTPVKGKKRVSIETPQKGRRRKSLMTSTSQM